MIMVKIIRLQVTARVINYAGLVILVIMQTLTAMKMAMKNKLLQSLCREKDRLNSNEAQIPINYAYGWAISTDEGTYTLQMLLDKADSDMYENKQLCKKRNLG